MIIRAIAFALILWAAHESALVAVDAAASIHTARAVSAATINAQTR